MSAAKKKEKLNFEAALAELQHLVDQMEQGQLSLEEALQQFERGITLVRHCQETLKNAEQTVQMLVEKNGGETLVSYQDETKQ
jgi:exodeoxyribonuclease VII small subunit